MSRSIQLIATLHEFQGPKFRGYIEDQSYRTMVRNFVCGADFVFEEAARRSPSIAEECADSILGSGHYLDIDPPAAERPQYGIREHTGCGCPIDPCGSPDMYESQFVDEHRKREELWLRRIQAQNFEKGLVILGVAHGLSFAFGLQQAGICVELANYLPFNKLCFKKHAV